MKKNSIRNIYFERTFIQALLLTSVFHEGLSFMEVGHNLMCVSTLAPYTWGFIWGAVTLTLVALPLEALAISPISGFQIAFPCIIW